jgi:6-methylsalicylate decarboxylase
VSFTIDVHHHILPDIFWRATNDAHSPVGGILPAPWSKESTLSYMDDAGIDVAITSISTPGVHIWAMMRRPAIWRAVSTSYRQN